MDRGEEEGAPQASPWECSAEFERAPTLRPGEVPALARLPSVAAAAAAPDPLLPRMVSVLRCRQGTNPYSPEQTVWLVGTAHVSEQSCADVARVIRLVQPQVVLLELCHERRGMLTMDKQQAAHVPSLAEMVADWRSGRAGVFQVVYAWMLARVAGELAVLPGEEFRVALREAAAVGAKVVLGDRPVSLTLARTWAALGTWERARLVWALLAGGLHTPDPDELRQLLEECKETDVVTAMLQEVGQQFPGLLRPLVAERDQFMVFQLQQLARQASRIVAVVGAGHLPGMRAQWDADIDIEELVRAPDHSLRRRRRWRLLAAGVAAGGLVTGVVLLVRRQRPLDAGGGSLASSLGSSLSSSLSQLGERLSRGLSLVGWPSH